MHKGLFQSVTKQVHIMVILTNYKSGDFYLEGYHIEFTSPKVKYCPIEFDIDSINEGTKYTCCTPILSPNFTDKNIIMHQLIFRSR